MCANGSAQEVDWAHAAVATKLGGAVTFVGKLDELHAVAVGLASPPVDAPLHTLAGIFFQPATVRGNVVIVASDDNGEEMDLDIEAMCRHLHIHNEPPRQEK